MLCFFWKCKHRWEIEIVQDVIEFHSGEHREWWLFVALEQGAWLSVNTVWHSCVSRPVPQGLSLERAFCFDFYFICHHFPKLKKNKRISSSLQDRLSACLFVYHLSLSISLVYTKYIYYLYIYYIYCNSGFHSDVLSHVYSPLLPFLSSHSHWSPFSIPSSFPSMFMAFF